MTPLRWQVLLLIGCAVCLFHEQPEGALILIVGAIVIGALKK